MSDTDENYTPNTLDQPVIDLVLKVLGEIDLDPCSNSSENPNVPALEHFTKEDDCLCQGWNGNVFLNPPYSSPFHFLDKLTEAFEIGMVPEAIALLKIGTISNKGTGALIESHASAICFWGAGKNRRIGFINQDGEQRMGADFDCVLVYFGTNWPKFYHVFTEYGHVTVTDKTIKQSLLTP